MEMRRTRASLLAAAIPALHACVALPVPFSQQREVQGQEVTRLDVLRLSPGRTTRSEVIALLGKPVLQWSAERTLVYAWSARQSRTVLVSNQKQPLGFDQVHDGTKAHEVALQFDARDQLLRIRNVVEDTVGHDHASLHQWVVDGLMAQTASLGPGIASRADVMALLGSPRYRHEDNALEVYEWDNVNLLLQFSYDASGRVIDKRKIAKPVVLQGDYAEDTVTRAD
jgi:outer membrane protein assembly factor BamE (lipoprotein component of BamABCDE complex)